MRTEAEHIAEGIREYVAKLNELLSLACNEELRVLVVDQFQRPRFSQQTVLTVESIERTEIL